MPKTTFDPGIAASSFSGTRAVTAPFDSIRVPLVECRSVTHTPPGTGTSRACVLDTDRLGSKMLTRWAWG